MVSDGLQVNLKFRTLANDGLIFYATNDDQGNAASSFLSLIDGQLVFNSQGEVLRTSPSDVKFNDNEWHVVTATHGQSALGLDIDDTKSYSTDSAPPPLHFLYGSLYIGGLPLSVLTLEPVDAVPFVGCIGDATVNSEIIINFANATERPNAFLGKCKGGDQTRTLQYCENSLSHIRSVFNFLLRFAYFSLTADRRTRTFATVIAVGSSRGYGGIVDSNQ